MGKYIQIDIIDSNGRNQVNSIFFRTDDRTLGQWLDEYAEVEEYENRPLLLRVSTTQMTDEQYKELGEWEP